ncbi:hypothetical protein PR202_gb21567 [Eleusine coracana subsp. coracana]|uniref:Uncharacterized protein n=1 Tax=Eleusine coracana subsp. coracana TaxID=191504 RepID=A0AAV5FDH7_ELECO|nr:hypothetical protein PR202_gb21567 [Eleusine coracana subsp. coracana]
MSLKSTMGIQRRFLNLIVDSPGCGTKSLRCIDLSRQKLFNKTAPAQQTSTSGSESGGGPREPTIRAPEVSVNQKKKQAALKFGRISLPDPSFSFRAAVSDLNDRRMHSFPLGDSRVFCADQSGRGFVLEEGSRRLVEYVAEQKLWFGVSARERQFAAADLSVMESQPQLLAGTLEGLDLPEEWKECKDPQIVYLGAGKFCIGRFFHSRTPNGDNLGDELSGQNTVILTGGGGVPCQ